MSNAPVDYGVTNDNYKPDAPPLTNDELIAAKADLVRDYPKISRHKVDPSTPDLAMQKIANVSYMLLKEPIDGVYGFMKVRGTWPDVETATKDDERIIKTVDSVFPIHQAWVGHWVPITNNPRYSQDQMDVKMKEQDAALRDRAAKENNAKNEQMRRELEERKEQLEDTTRDLDNDPLSLDYYTKKKVSERELKTYIVQGNEKLKKLKKSLKKIQDDIEKINVSRPTYRDQWLDHYNKARVKAGLDVVESELDIDKAPVFGNTD